MRELLATLKPWILAASLLTLAAVFLSPAISAISRRWRASAGVPRAAFLLVFLLATLCGGAKHNATITFPRTDPETWYLTDAGSYVTNNAVHVKMTKSPILPLTANIFLDALQIDCTNASDWAEHSFNVYSNTLTSSGLEFDVPYTAATNYNWQCYTDWTPAPTTHTNGVAYIVWQIGVGKLTNDLVLTRTGVYTNTVRLAPTPAITNHPTVSLTLTTGSNNED